MGARKNVFRCQQCGYVSPKWVGRCPDCQNWHSLVEEAAPRNDGPRAGGSVRSCPPVALANIPQLLETRILSGMNEWDRVLGGGLIPGTVVLLAGDPGIGKSTLLLQSLARLARQQRVLYVSGEESAQQLKMRADRLKIDSANLYIFSENSLEDIFDACVETSPAILAIDSIQTVHSRSLEVSPGSISQVRECASKLMRLAKERDISVFLIGHVTKEGAIAGPRVLEHLVDTVLYLEGDRSHAFRILRVVKNRFGSCNEIGVFEMKEAGMEEVANPSQLFLSERPTGVSGSVVVCTIEGTRPLLVELQALVSPTGWMQPRRTSMGVDGNRLSLLLAVLEKKLGFNFAQNDVFVNVAGGVRLSEPAADLAMITGLMSSYLDRPIAADLAVWGEVGLAGEVRGVGHALARVNEALKLGFTRHLIPKSNSDRLLLEVEADCIGVKSLGDVLNTIFDGG
jgi:DNA repair protein RadA/Sms